MKFIDSTEIRVKAGNGGDGMVCFAAAFGAPKLGPDGGNGGNGGNVYCIARQGINTLSRLRYKQLYKADDGIKGGSNRKTGACGKDIYIDVPCGSVISDLDTGKILGEVTKEGQTLLVAEGGRRGLGNAFFLSSTHQRPQESTPGKKGEQKNLGLELKLLADVGLAGFPNAGKSTLLSKISAARPKIAGYPFTTLTPNLGVCDLSDEVTTRSFVMADVPGLIEGASIGKGLGHEFLRHLERTKVILHVIDAIDYMGTEPVDALLSLRNELEKYSSLLCEKPAVVALNKVEELDEEIILDLTAPIKELGYEVFPISAIKNQGLSKLKHHLVEMIELQQKASDEFVNYMSADSFSKNYLQKKSSNQEKPGTKSQITPGNAVSFGVENPGKLSKGQKALSDLLGL